MPSEVLPGTSLPEFAQLLFAGILVASCYEHSKQSKFPVVRDYG